MIKIEEGNRIAADFSIDIDTYAIYVLLITFSFNFLIQFILLNSNKTLVVQYMSDSYYTRDFTLEND